MQEHSKKTDTMGTCRDIMGNETDTTGTYRNIIIIIMEISTAPYLLKKKLQPRRVQKRYKQQ